MSRRRPGRRKEAAQQQQQLLQPRPEDDGRLLLSKSALPTDLSKITNRPVHESPWGPQGLGEVQLPGERHYRLERLPPKAKERPKSTRLSSLFYPNLQYVHSIADTLEVLELSNTGLLAFPEQLAEQLYNIETLILDNNSLGNDSFPPSFRNFALLTTLSVRNNRLTSIPSCWANLYQLQVLYIDSNEVGSLQNLERLGKLQILSVQDNRVVDIPRQFYVLKKLEYLNLSRNRIHTVTVEVKRWINLKELDLSHNCLTFLIPDIFMLPKLNGLNVSHNEISKIPTVTLKMKDRRRIQSVDISFNSLTRFPDNVFYVSESLDLSSNSIKVINNSAFKKLDWRTTKKLCMSDNPVNTPPREICDGGLRSMLHYYFETKVESKIYQGIKVFLLGSQGCGKSSLVQTFLDQQSRLTTDDEETVCLETYDYQIDTNDDPTDPRPLSLSVWDCSGSFKYLQYIFPFLHMPSLALVLFDLTQYRSEEFHDHIGQWIDLLILRNNRAVFILIGTKADLCPKDVDPAEVLEQAQKDTEEYIKAYLDSIDHEINCIERLDQISAAFNEQYRQYLSLKNFKTLFHPEAIVTSSAKMVGFDRLEIVLIDLATQTKTFPGVMRAIPALWGDVDTYLEDFSLSHNILTLQNLGDIIHKQFGLRHLTNQICQYLHESGKAIFCEKEPPFKTIVVVRPCTLFECTRLVFRHDLFEFLLDHSDKEEIRERFTKTKSSSEYQSAVQLATVHGILTQHMIKTLWGTGKRLFMLVNYLCDNLQWCYRVGRCKESNVDGKTVLDINLNCDVERDEEGIAKTDISKVNLLVPAQVRLMEPDEAVAQWARVGLTVRTALRFTRFTPHLLFERLLVALHSEKLRYQHHWRTGVIAFDTGNPSVWIRVTREEPEDKAYLVSLACGMVRRKSTQRHGNEDEAKMREKRKADIADIWRCLLPAILEAEKLIKQYPAAWFRREVCCPGCNEYTFWGEWLSPKEAHDMETKMCASCHENVETGLLVQPRLTKKRKPSAKIGEASGAQPSIQVKDAGDAGSQDGPNATASLGAPKATEKSVSFQ